MPKYNITRTSGTAGITAAVQTLANLDTDIVGATPGPVTVPPNVTRLVKVSGVLSASAETATDSGGVVSCRLSGTGLKDGQQDFVLGGYTSIAQGTPATGIFMADRPIEIELDLPVTPSGLIQAQVAISGVDPGTPQIGLTFTFA